MLPNTKRLVDGKFLEIKDIGPSTKPVKLDRAARRISLAEKERELTANVRKVLADNPNKKSEGKGTAEPVKASDVGDAKPVEPSPKPAIVPDPPKPEPDPKKEEAKKGKKK